MTKTESINITKLREYAFTQLPRDSALREVLLAEDGEIDVSIFLARVSVWLRLSALKRGNNR